MSVRPWNPKCLPDFISDYLGGMDDMQLAIKYEGTVDQVKRCLRRLRKHENLPQRDALGEPSDFTYRGIKEKGEFVAFLSRSKTKQEIFKKFGDLGETLLYEQWDDYQLFEQRNDYNEQVFILIPKIKKDYEVKPRAFEFHRSTSSHGDFCQPYELIQLPVSAFDNEEECVDILPLYDVHYGHFGHKKEKFLSYIRSVAENPNVYAFIGGDLLENALDDGRGMGYDQSLPPSEQIDEAIALLAPIAHKMLFMLMGNHEARTHKRAGLDIVTLIGKELDIPTFSGPVYCTILGAGRKWKIYAFHGSSGSQTKGGQINAASKPRTFTDFTNFYVSGHVHHPSVNSDVCLVEDTENCRLHYKETYTVICPSFLRWENTYAYRAGYSPPGHGGVVLKLYSNGDYEALHRNR